MQLCRLLFRLRSHNQMSILSRCDRFEEWLRETAAFTEECFFVSAVSTDPIVMGLQVCKPVILGVGSSVE